MTLFAATLLVALGIASGAQTPRRASHHYFVSPGGDDAGPGTEAAPFRTVQHGADACAPGDRLTILDGVYRESVALTRSGSYFGRDIVIEAAPGAEVVLEGSGKRATFDTNGMDHLIVRGLKVRNGGYWGIGIAGSWRVRLENCQTDNTPGTGIMVDKAHDVVVTGCDVARACMRGGEESISVKRSTSVVVEKTSVHDTMHEGIDVKEGSKHVVIRNCHVYNVERQGLYADAWDADTYDITFDGNRVHDCMMGLAACTESGGLLRDVTFVNNLIYDCRGPGMILAKWGNERMTHRIRNVAFLNNTVFRCGNGGKEKDWGGAMLLENDQAENIVVANNILAGCPQDQLRVDHLKLRPKKLSVHHNLISGPSERFGRDNVYAYPGFVDPVRDFRLRPDSPARRRGARVSGQPVMDIEGIARPSRGIDLGAYQER